MKKILIIGSGSIGQRHIRALLKIKNDISIAAFRTQKGHYKDLPEDIKNNVIEFYDLNEALNWKPTHMLISNPTSHHAEFIDIGIHNELILFVEKPMLNNINDLKKMKVSINKLKTYNAMVGFNLRFNALMKQIKKIISSNAYGKCLHASISLGHYLPFWHPYEDYKKAYYSKKELGGGVLRTISHEFDLIQYFFGKLKNLTAKVEKISDLEIDVEDCVDIIFEAEDCKVIILHMDFLNPLPERQGKILFEKGMLEYNYFSGEIYFTEYGIEKRELIFKNTDDYNQQYVEQMEHFIDDKDSDIASTFNESLLIMKIIDKCEKSNGNLELL